LLTPAQSLRASSFVSSAVSFPVPRANVCSPYQGCCVGSDYPTRKGLKPSMPRRDTRCVSSVCNGEMFSDGFSESLTGTDGFHTWETQDSANIRIIRQRVRLPSPPDSKLLPKYVSPARLTIICAFPPNRVETAEHLSKLTGQTTVVKEQLTRSGHGWSPHISRTTQEISRPLLTANEAMRMTGPKKDRKGLITEPGHMVVYVAGYAPSMAFNRSTSGIQSFCVELPPGYPGTL
jgi:hypothetical protein